MQNVIFFPKVAEDDFEESKPAKSKEIKKEHLVNKLNYINFQDGTILLNFEHKEYDRSISIPAKPQPCLGETIECVWSETDGILQKLKTYTFKNMHVPDGQKLLMVEPNAINITEKGIRVSLPEICWQFQYRKVLRHPCENIKTLLIQNSAVFSGMLIDFNANSFRVAVKVVPPQTFQWICPDSSVTAILSDERHTLYSGECKIIRQTFGQKKRFFVLEPVCHSIHRFMPKEYRSARQEFEPLPDIIFKHPFTQKLVSLKVTDISGAGFSVEENANFVVLLPGMIIPEIELNFANGFKIKFIAQVLYQKPIKDQNGSKRVRCGFTLLDMDMEDHSKLLSILNQAKNKNTYLSNKVDMDDLWNFFFETGFIYPKKYAFVQANKQTIKSTYEKLYTQCPNIARHFVYKENGHILGHMSMLRFIGNSWMVHHHASNKSESNRAGLYVLNQMHNYVNDTYRVYSAHLDFVFFYFRPENKFPSRVFGGANRFINNPKACSVDHYAYFHLDKRFYIELKIPAPWELIATQAEDLMELEIYYEHVSSGLMLGALGLEPDVMNQNDVTTEYQRHGFTRANYLYSLKKEGKLKAVIMVNISDIGLNLSDLINCIHVIVLDPKDLSKDIFFSVFSHLYEKYNHHDIPVLIYPVAYADSIRLRYEKQYTLWALSTQHSDPYLRFIKRLLRSV